MKVFRAKAGISQLELAEMVDVTRQTIHSIENAKINPSLIVALRIAASLDTTVDQLFAIAKEERPQKAYIVGIGGVSQSGKSTLAKKIKKGIVDRVVKIICIDDHPVAQNLMPRVHGLPDWEKPESYDFKKIRELIDRSKEVADVVILEGIHAFHDESINQLMDLKIEMEIPYKTFLKRRKKDNRWGNEEEWYYDHVWNMFLQNKPSHGGIIPLSGKDELDITKLLSKIRAAT